MTNLNVVDVTKAVEDILKTTPAVLNIATVIGRGEPINRNPDQTPWIGIYKGTLQYTPRTLGMSSIQWNLEIPVRIVMQVHSHEGSKAEEILEELIQAVLGALLDNQDLNKTAMQTIGFSVDYGYLEDEDSTAFFQMASLTTTVETMTG